MLAGDASGALAGLPSALRARGPGTVVVTLGERGALCAAEGEQLELPARTVDAVDTTAAGDAFVGALAVALVERRPLESALALACAAGTLAVMRAGAVPSLPDRAEVLAWMGGGR
jgi:ribokinase